VTGFQASHRPTNKDLVIDQTFISYKSANAHTFVNCPGQQFGRIKSWDQELRKKKMTDEKHIQEIETSVLALGTAYLATLLGMIYVLAA
jgi:hypothetical protein